MFIPVSVFIYWIPNTQMIVETDVLDYTLAVILLIIIKEKDMHLVVFHSYMFKAAELDYNLHNKKLPIVFEAFYIWYHYLEESELSIDIIIDHKNLKYFLITKILS